MTKYEVEYLTHISYLLIHAIAGDYIPDDFRKSTKANVFGEMLLRLISEYTDLIKERGDQ